jgi:diadenosine tetraphosphate (Ap4A) HIT family hydrolase
MTRAVARWGCFLPDLTRLASGSSTTNLPTAISYFDASKASRQAKKSCYPSVMEPFAIDPTLKSDTFPVADIGLCRLLLMNDSRFPWLILVPQRNGVTEIHDLSPLDQTMLTFETVTVSENLKRLTGCHKVNVAALGNQVRQLHMHVIARFTDDAAWPSPVWGSGAAAPYDRDAAESFIADFKAGFQDRN